MLAIFEKKSKWALLEESTDSWHGERWRDKYVSAAERRPPQAVRGGGERRPHDQGLSQEGPRRVVRASRRDFIGPGREEHRGSRVARGLRRDARRPCE